MLQKGQFEMTTQAESTSESGAIFIIFEQAIHRFSKWNKAMQCHLLSDILDLVYLCFV